MKALVYHGPGRHSWEDVPAPTLTDARSSHPHLETAVARLKRALPSLSAGNLVANRTGTPGNRAQRTGG